jgi:hypothetical protein
MTDVARWMEEVVRLGGTFELRGDRVTVEYSEDVAEVLDPILEKLRPKREEVRQLLYKHPPGVLAPPECPPLPPGVRLVRYAPKTPPVLVAPWSVVTDVKKFIAAYLRSLDWRLKHPKGYAAAPLPEILAKLAEVGLELEVVEAAPETHRAG